MSLASRNAFKILPQLSVKSIKIEGKMREDIRQEIQRKIAEKFEQAHGPKPRKISEEERQARTRNLECVAAAGLIVSAPCDSDAAVTGSGAIECSCTHP